LSSIDSDVEKEFELEQVLYTDSAVVGDTAGIGMGLVRFGNARAVPSLVVSLLAHAKDTSRKNIVRGVGVASA